MPFTISVISIFIATHKQSFYSTPTNSDNTRHQRLPCSTNIHSEVTLHTIKFKSQANHQSLFQYKHQCLQHTYHQCQFCHMTITIIREYHEYLHTDFTTQNKKSILHPDRLGKQDKTAIWCNKACKKCDSCRKNGSGISCWRHFRFSQIGWRRFRYRRAPSSCRKRTWPILG